MDFQYPAEFYSMTNVICFADTNRLICDRLQSQKYLYLYIDKQIFLLEDMKAFYFLQCACFMKKPLYLYI